MELIRKHGIIIFWILLFADCFLLYQEKMDYHPFLRPALVVVLGFYVFLNAKKKKFFRTKLICFFAILTSFLGDIFVVNQSETLFTAGMVAFIFAHIFYTIYFYKIVPINFSKLNETLILGAIAIGVVFYQIFKFLKEDLALQPHLKTPMMIYAVFSGIMALLAIHVYTNKSRRTLATNFYIPGALLLIFADIVLAFYKLHYVDVSFLAIIILLSYGYGQSLLLQGIGKYLKG